jgi:hypothetical protein
MAKGSQQRNNWKEYSEGKKCGFVCKRDGKRKVVYLLLEQPATTILSLFRQLHFSCKKSARKM